MVFNSFQFLWLFPLIFLLYWGLSCLPNVSAESRRKAGNAMLIVASYGLYMQWKPAYALLLLGITAVTYVGALSLRANRRRGLVATFATLALVPLVVFKYYNFINDSVARLLSSLGIASNLPGLNWAIPVGISFYTFQAVGYLFDVYYGRIEAYRGGRNWWDYVLFVSFFPQILSGPINRAGDLLPQIRAPRSFHYGQAVSGLKLLLWGMFLKVVLADRLGIYVNTVFDNWQYNTGLSCLAASLSYTFQIYGDFAGYSLMAIGTGKLMGFELANNFRRPYLAVSVTDFWRRWHISLSLWLRDYVYIPLGGSRCSKGRNYLNIFLTFLVSGIWHGANWTFIVWGVLHGVFQIIEKALGLQTCERKSFWARLPRIAVTFVLVNFLWTIFRMPSLHDAVGVIGRIFTCPGAMLSPGNLNSSFMVMSLGIVMVSELLAEFAPGKFALLDSPRRGIRWVTYVALLSLIMLAGVFDSGQFIYVSF